MRIRRALIKVSGKASVNHLHFQIPIPSRAPVSFNAVLVLAVMIESLDTL